MTLTGLLAEPVAAPANFNQMRIGLARQNHLERRVGLSPEMVKRLVTGGHTVEFDESAGVSAGWSDNEYLDAGATIAVPGAVWKADLTATVSQLDDAFIGDTSTVIGLLRPFDEPEKMKKLAQTGATIFAFEAVPRTTRAQSLDALSSQATVAGYQAVLEAAALSNRLYPMLTTAAGTLPPARVLVLGAGVAGLQAIATARRLGAVVSAFDVREAAAEQVQSLGATFISAQVTAQDAASSGGYAKEVDNQEQEVILRTLAPRVAEADVVISTAAIPGRAAPLLINAEMVESMRAGSVIVDVAAVTGGNCALTKPGEVIEHHGVTIVGSTDLESRKAGDASRMYARNMVSFIELLTGDSGSKNIDWDDEIVTESCIANEGKLVHPRIQVS